VSRIVVIDHGAGNLVSIAQGLRRAGATVDVVDDPADIGDPAGIVLPGVGATGTAMARLEEAGFVDTLHDWSGPLLGICVGLQLFFDRSQEDEDGRCLGLVAGEVRRIENAPLLPHIGWNDVTTTTPDPLFAGLPSGTPFYFVHSFAPVPDDPAVVIGTTDYGGPVVAAVRHGNRVGVQFHPERSATAGLRMLGNFVTICEERTRAA
jgi:glutamine amidotransferase